METPADTKFTKLESIYKLVNDSLTKEEFVRSFEVLRKSVAGMQAKNVTDFQEMNASLKDFAAKLNKDSASDISDMKLEFQTLWDMHESDMMSRMKAMEVRVSSLKDGKTPSKQELTTLVIPLIDERVIIDENSIAEIAATRLEANLPAFGMAFRNALELLPEGEKLSPDAIEGLQNALEEVVANASPAVRAGWGAHPLTIQSGGAVKAKVVRTINFTGATVTLSPSGVVTVAISGGTGGGAFLTPTGTVNGTNFTFGVATRPTMVMADGMGRVEGFGYTYSASNIILDIPPQDWIRYQ